MTGTGMNGALQPRSEGGGKGGSQTGGVGSVSSRSVGAARAADGSTAGLRTSLERPEPCGACAPPSAAASGQCKERPPHRNSRTNGGAAPPSLHPPRALAQLWLIAENFPGDCLLASPALGRGLREACPPPARTGDPKRPRLLSASRGPDWAGAAPGARRDCSPSAGAPRLWRQASPGPGVFRKSGPAGWEE